jgi:methyl-accepting chemotaxis protein
VAAVNQMDQVTRQNAAMVEETTAASRMLADQTEELFGLVSRFQVNADHPQATETTPRAQAATRTYRSAGNTALAEEDWTEF